MSQKKQLFLTIIGLFLLGLIVTSGSYAFWSLTANNTKNITFNSASSLANYIEYDAGESKFVGDFNVSSTYNTGIHSTIALNKTDGASSIPMKASINMDINAIGTNMKISSALKWIVTEGTSSNIGNVLANGNFIGANANDTLTLVPNIEVTTTKTYYTIWIWLDAGENPSDALSGETLDTVVWTQIDQAEGVSGQYEITRINANYQTINATVVSNEAKVTNYAVTTTNEEPSTWTSITSADQSYVYNLEYDAPSTGTYYVWFKNANNEVVSRSISVASVDTTAPTCNFGQWSATPIQNEGTSNIELTCTDSESQITIGNLKVSDFTKSGNNINITNIAKASVTNGYKYTITVTGTTNDGTATITLPADKVKNALGLGNTSKTSSSIEVANTYTVSFSSNNANCTLDSSYNTYTATYGTAFTKGNPTCNGYTFTGWTANSGLDTTNAKYGTSSSTVTTTWSNASTPVTATWFNNLAKRDDKTVTLTANWTGNQYTATFYYNNNTSCGGTTVASTTASCTVSNSNGNCTVTIPTAVANSVGSYNNAYAGLSENTGNMTAAVAEGTTTITLSANKAYYSLYRSAITIYEPTSTSVAAATTYYRNQWFTSTTALATTIISDTQTGTSNWEFVSKVNTYPVLAGYAATPTYSVGWSSVAALATANTCPTTVYQILKGNIITGTFYYNSNTTGDGTVTISTATADSRKTLYCTSTTTADTRNGSYSIPSVVTNSVGPYGETYVNVGKTLNSMTNNNTNAYTTYYAYYRSPVTNYYYDGTSYTTRTLYRNSVFTSTSNIKTVLSSTNTGVTNYETETGPGNSEWAGLSAERNANPEYTTVAAAAASNIASLYTVYQFNVNYLKGSNISTIGATSASCKVSATGASTGGTSCNVTLPSITANTGYTPAGWVSSESSKLSPGDYVSYTPSVTSYTTDTAYTGHTSTQTINPSELNLWRVLSINQDGTVDIISDSVSSVKVYFGNKAGYKNIVGYLNVLANQYETTGITVGSRHFGYNGQTEFISDDTYFVNPAPWTCSTNGTSGDCTPDPDDYEAYGGGDTLYLNDYNLVNTVLGTCVANKAGTSTAENYWMASRQYGYGSATSYNLNVRYVYSDGYSSTVSLYFLYNGRFTRQILMNTIRPIVTLASTLSYSGDGTSESPYTITGSSTVIPAGRTYTVNKNVDTLYATATGNTYTATFKYQSGSSTVSTMTATCTVSNDAGNCNATIPSRVTSSVGTYGTPYFGLSNNYGNMTAAYDKNATTVTLSANATYYSLYSGPVTIYYPDSTSTVSSTIAYRTQWFSGASSMATSVLSTTETGTTNDFTFTNSVTGYNFNGFATTPGSSTSTQSINTLRTSTATTVYAIISKSNTSTFYYYNGSSQSSSNASATQYLGCTSSSVVVTDSTFTIPSQVTSSVGPNSSPYIGLSTTTSSTTITTTVNTANINYYAVYGGDYTATFTKDNTSVSAIGSSSLSCSSSYTTDGTTYTGTDCTITMPSITPATGYKSIGWYDSDDNWFSYSNTDIILTQSDTFTAKGKRLTASDLLYDNSNSGVECDDVQCMIDYLDNDNNITIPNLQPGDYISYTPSKTSYTTIKAMTGYTSTQTINPSELNLWRVINIHDDGSVDIISENVSSIAVYFSGQTGYQNLVGYLNVLASQYETSGITVGSRHFGYNGQTEFITDTTYFVNPAPWTCSTSGTCTPDPDDYEASGGGDTLYTSDFNLVNTVLGTRIANKVGTSTATAYWMASRYYSYSGATIYHWHARNVSTSGSGSYYGLYHWSGSQFYAYSYSFALRPIVTLASGLSYSGNGTSASPYVVSQNN